MPIDVLFHVTEIVFEDVTMHISFCYLAQGLTNCVLTYIA